MQRSRRAKVASAAVNRMPNASTAGFLAADGSSTFEPGIQFQDIYGKTVLKQQDEL